jgi:hypothetical protein
MKRLSLFLFILLAAAAVAIAGEIATLPQAINLNTPTTNKVELLSMTHYYGSSPYAVIRYNVVDTNGSVIEQQQVVVDTGVDYSAFVDGYGATMKTRGNTAVWQDIQGKYTLVE